jgi:hypothetical protein
VLLFATGEVKPTLVDRTLAAVGHEPVLHAVIRQPRPSDTTLVELSTGKRVDVPRVVEPEIWFDQERGLEHTITRATGRPTQDELFTPQGSSPRAGQSGRARESRRIPSRRRENASAAT